MAKREDGLRFNKMTLGEGSGNEVRNDDLGPGPEFIRPR